jgi:MOSC domain-containing protein YiiM/SAM-dependent methyltransferase
MTGTIHPAAARGFEGATDAYERGRPDYPADAVRAIVDQLDLRPGRTLLELGAGTGKLTRLLVPTGAHIVAVEPVAGMRAKLASVIGDAGSVEIVDGTAEAIPLPAASVDAVVVAQAFHWFDAIRALSEIHRVLRPGGRLLLAWNRRDESVPWVRGLGELIRTLAAGEPQVWDAAWRASLDRCALFGAWDRADFRHVQRLTRDGVLDRVASVSYVAAAEPAARAELLANVEAMLRDDPGIADLDVIDLPYDTEVLSAERRSIEPGLEGVIASVNLNRGGVPKPPVDGTWVHALGLEGDGHDNPDVHGGPTAAVCLYAQEAIERVRADGHQAFPGSYGENLTLLGIDWGELREGDRLDIAGGGTDGEAGPLLELTQNAAPCQTQAQWFTGARISRISAKVRPEDARWYGRVLREGRVVPGMRVRVIREA